ncbi:hypothetical protein HOD41_09095 [bacterium]|jgi:flagellar biosynthesis/type III secretory pathway protein FliH|nr:hypothetical protein [bacterium]MBT7310805.1 hypothetical protein [bacterium]
MLKWSPKSLGVAGADPEELTSIVLDGNDLAANTEFYTDIAEKQAAIEKENLAILRSELRKEISETLAVEKEAEISAYQQNQIDLYNTLAEQIRASAKENISSLANGAVELAIAMAGQVMRREIDVDKDTILRAIQPLLFKAETGAKLVVTANPEDAAYLESQTQFCEKMNIVKVIADPRCERGGCTVKADTEEWDLTIESKLTVLADTVRLAMQSTEDIQEDN